jgi:hypothetical protein
VSNLYCYKLLQFDFSVPPTQKWLLFPHLLKTGLNSDFALETEYSISDTVYILDPRFYKFLLPLLSWNALLRPQMGNQPGLTGWLGFVWRRSEAPQPIARILELLAHLNMLSCVSPGKTTRTERNNKLLLF